MRPLFLIWALAGAATLAAADAVTLYVGESRLIDLENPKKLVIGNTALLEARALDEHQLLLNGKAPGRTSLLAWDKLGQEHAYEVEIQPSALKRAMVEIDVQVLEIADGVQWDAGLDWAGAMQGQSGAVAPATPLSVLEQSPPLLSWGTFTRGPLSTRLDFLLQNNKARLLAKPRLVTVSGSKARFLSGGQIPVPLTDAQGRTNAQYKDYGISLDIEPKADEDGNVSADVRAEMSDVDPANSVSIGNGGVLPAIKIRWVETSVFVRKDSTLVLAGLLHEEEGLVTAGVPLLSQIPVLGLLFQHQESTTKKTELVIFLSPRVVQ